MNIPCILIPALVGLICGILGYLLGKMNSKNDDSLALSLQADLDACKANTKNLNARIATLEADLAAKAKVTTQSFAAASPTLIPFDAALAANVLGKISQYMIIMKVIIPVAIANALPDSPNVLIVIAVAMVEDAILTKLFPINKTLITFSL